MRKILLIIALSLTCFGLGSIGTLSLVKAKTNAAQLSERKQWEHIYPAHEKLFNNLGWTFNEVDGRFIRTKAQSNISKEDAIKAVQYMQEFQKILAQNAKPVTPVTHTNTIRFP